MRRNQYEQQHMIWGSHSAIGLKPIREFCYCGIRAIKYQQVLARGSMS